MNPAPTTKFVRDSSGSSASQARQEAAPWAVVGAEVAVVRLSENGQDRAVRWCRITSRTATHLQTDDEQRFALTSLQYTAGGLWDRITYRLFPADDDRVHTWSEQAAARQRDTEARATARAFADRELGVQPTDVIRALCPLFGPQLADALAQLLELADPSAARIVRSTDSSRAASPDA